MLITLQNLTLNRLSTSIGVAEAQQTISAIVSDFKFNQIIDELLVLQISNTVKLTVTDSRDNKYSLLNRGPNLVTTADMTIYVDVATGSDLYSGTATRPFKTVGAALASLPDTIAHNVTILVAAGTYDEPLFITQKTAGQGVLTIQGASWAAFTPATGAATGTFDASFAGLPYVQQAKLTGATWTIDDLSGKWLEVTTGPLIGNRYPILSNTADTIDFAQAVNNGGGSAVDRIDLQSVGFKFVSQGAVFTSTTANPGSPTSYHDVVNVVTNDTSVLYLADLELRAAAGYGCSVSGGKVTLFQCLLSGATAYAGVESSRGAIDISITKCHFATTSALIGNISGASSGGHANVTSSTFKGGTAGLEFVNLDATLVGNSFAGQTSHASSFDRCGIFWLTGNPLINASTIGLDIYGPCRAQLSYALVTGCTTAGIRTSMSASGASGSAVISLDTTTINLCGAGVLMEAPYTHVYVKTAGAITNSATYGVNMVGVKQSGHSQFGCNAAMTMTGNTVADILLATGVTSTIAALRADVDKDIQDATRFNRICED